MKRIRFGIKGYFYVQKISFRAIGLEINSAERIFERPYLSAIFATLFTLLMISWLDDIYRNREKDLIELTDALLPFFHTFTVIYKIFTFVLKHKKMIQIIQRIWAMTEKATTEERLIIADENATDRKFSVFYYTWILAAFIICSILPHFVSFYFYMKTGNLQLFSPLQLSTPFDQSQPVYYFITAGWLAGGIFFISHCASSMDTLFCWFVLNIAAQFRVLQHNFKRAASLRDPAEMEVVLKECVVQHQSVIALAVDLNDTFKEIIFIEFAVNGLQTCLLAILLSSGSVPFRKFIFFVVFLGVMMFQFIIYCYGGQRIQDESTNIGSEIYDAFHWHTVSVKNKKLLILPILRSQKRCAVTGIFFVADWLLFQWVLQSTYSMMALVQSFGG